MKTARDEMDIVNAYRAVGTYRGAAALCGTTHKTVRRVMERRERGEVGQRMAQETKATGVAGLIEERVRLSDGRISAKRMLPVAQAAGYTGSLRVLQRAVKSAKEQWKRKRRTYRPWVPIPGEYLVVDWASEAGWEMFGAVLAWSRYRFIRFGPNQTRESTLALLAECFEELGGVPKRWWERPVDKWTGPQSCPLIHRHDDAGRRLSCEANSPLRGISRGRKRGRPGWRPEDRVVTPSLRYGPRVPWTRGQSTALREVKPRERAAKEEARRAIDRPPQSGALPFNWPICCLDTGAHHGDPDHHEK